jgi:type VI secretion system secreted protein Hcp
MKKISFIKIMTVFLLAGFAMCVIGGDLNPGNTPSPTMRTLDELYKNIQPGLPSDWMSFPKYTQVEQGGAINMTVVSETQGAINGSCTKPGKENTITIVGLGQEITHPDPGSGGASSGPLSGLIYVTKYIDKSSPKLYQTMCEGQHLDVVELKFYRTSVGGGEEHYYTIRVEDTAIASIRTAFPNLEEVGFVAGLVRWTWELDGVILHQHNFAAPH